MRRFLQAFWPPISILALVTALLPAPSARADFTFTQGTGQTGFSFTAATGGSALCAASVTHCFASVPIDTAGAQLFATGNAGFVRFPSAQAVTGTFFQATQPISAASLPLPSGAATEATLALLRTDVQSDVPNVTGPLNAATAVATKSLIVGGQFLTTQPTMTNTQQASLLFSPRGAVYVMTGAEKLLVTPDSVALPANQSVNVAQMNGVTTTMGNGVAGTGVQRVAIASDNTAFLVNGAQGSAALSATNGGFQNIVQGNAVLSATNGLFNNLLQGNAALSATNGLFANVLQGNAVLSTTNPLPTSTAPAISTVTTSITRPADTTAYAANDNLSNSTSAPTAGGFTLTSACRASGGSGEIRDAVVSASAGTSYQGEVWIFDQAVTAVNDNAAFTVSDSDILNLVGVFPFTTSDVTAANSISYVTGTAFPIGYTCVGTANLRYLVKIMAAATPGNAEVLTVRIKVAN